MTGGSGLWARFSESVGRAELLMLGDRLALLETAVAEERTLLDPLERQVAALEQSLLPVLAALAADRAVPATEDGV